MGKRFHDSVRAGDVVARLGGDEFVIIPQELTDVAQVAEIGRKLNGPWRRHRRAAKLPPPCTASWARPSAGSKRKQLERLEDVPPAAFAAGASVSLIAGARDDRANTLEMRLCDVSSSCSDKNSGALHRKRSSLGETYLIELQLGMHRIIAPTAELS
jgi:GGDEF domain-containing protein